MLDIPLAAFGDAVQTKGKGVAEWATEPNSNKVFPEWSGELEQRLLTAHAPTLLMTTAHVVGDFSLLRPEWQPDHSMEAKGGGYSDDVAAAIRQTCIARLRTFSKSGEFVPPRPTVRCSFNRRALAHGKGNGCVYSGPKEPPPLRWGGPVRALVVQASHCAGSTFSKS